MNLIWLSEAGFWFTLGVGTALGVLLVTLILLSKITDWVFALFGDDPASIYVFKELPDHYISMNLKYCNKTESLKATATYMYMGYTHNKSIQTNNVFFTSLENASTDIQLKLMHIIAQEIKEWNQAPK